MRRQIIYLAGPYTGNRFQKLRNIWRAMNVAGELWKQGMIVFSPHLNMGFFDSKLTYGQAMDACLEFLSRCDAVVMMPGWEASRGSVHEHGMAKLWGLPVCYWPNIQAIVESAVVLADPPRAPDSASCNS